MNLITKISLLISFVFVSSMAYGLADYRCIIERVHGVDSDSDPALVLKRKIFIGEAFTVDRVTGVMVGALKNSYATRPQVIDHGSKDNAFKVVTTMRIDQGAGYGSAVYTLVINEYVESTSKPFVFLLADVVYFGKCTHFQ